MSAFNALHYQKWNRSKKHMWFTKAIAQAMPFIGATASMEAAETPVIVKLFNPQGAGSWYIVEANLETGEAFGYADLGNGTPELGYMDLNEMRAYKGRFGLPLERDEWFAPTTLAAVMREAHA